MIKLEKKKVDVLEEKKTYLEYANQSLILV